MVNRAPESNAFEFVVLATRRAHQLMRGCTPRMPGTFKSTTMAQLEVAAGKVVRLVDPVVIPPADKG